MVDNFEVEPKYEDRTHKRHQFKLVIDGRNYKGDYHNGQIEWLHPHPKQTIDEDRLLAVEAEVYNLLGEHGLADDTDHLEVTPIEKVKSRKIKVFKLKIQGEEYKGTFYEDKIEWFHPQPVRKLDDKRVKNIEEKIQKKLKDLN